MNGTSQTDPQQSGDGVPADILTFAIEAARECGTFLKESFDRPKSDYEEKSPGDLVSEVDRESQRIARQILMRHTPDARFLAEEDPENAVRDSAEAGRLTWIVDPLDGTANFLHRFPMFAVSVGAAVDRVLKAAVVINPVTGECFAAAEGMGATMDGDPIRVSDEDRLDHSLLATGWPFRRKEILPPYMQVFQRVLNAAQGVRRAGSASLDLSYTAAGRLEGFWEYGLRIWDVAAGALIVREAGGRVSDFAGSDNWWESGDIVASNGRIHQSLLDAAGTPGGVPELERGATPALP